MFNFSRHLPEAFGREASKKKVTEMFSIIVTHLKDVTSNVTLKVQINAK